MTGRDGIEPETPRAPGRDPLEGPRAVDLPEPEQRALAAQFWSEINHPNLVDHIEPTAARADAVVVKRVDHTLDRVEWRG